MRFHQHKIGPLKINLPDENQSSFSIFEDLAEFFGKEFQREAVKLIRAKLISVKPKAAIDYESDFTHITTSNVDTLLSVISAIIDLSTQEHKHRFGQVDWAALKEKFINSKKNKPKPKQWLTGDVFAVPLVDGSFAFGQVLEKKYCTCALFDLRLMDSSLNQETFRSLQPVSIVHLSNGDLLNNGHWQVLFNEKVTVNPNSGQGGRFGEIGSTSYGGCSILEDFSNAYWGLAPWNVMYDENYYDKMLLKGLHRPATILILNEVDRAKYRNEKFGVT
jgi:hypothetical protein